MTDLDLDGHPDVHAKSFSCSGAGFLSYRGNGAGRLTFACGAWTGTYSPLAGTRVGDVSGAGMPDIVCSWNANACGELIPGSPQMLTLQSFAGGCPGTSSCEAAGMLKPDFDEPFSLHDLDGRGSVDLVSRSGGSPASNHMVVLPSDGAGGFMELRHFTDVPAPILMGDLDGDGLPEALGVNVGGIWVCRNLTPTPGFTNRGGGVAGGNGIPVLSGAGALRGGSDVQILLSNGPFAAADVLVLGASVGALPFKGCVLVPAPDVLVSTSTDAAGVFTLEAHWPFVLGPGTATWWQAWVADGRRGAESWRGRCKERR